MTYYSLPTGKLHKKTETKDLAKIPTSYDKRSYETLADPFDKSFDTLFQRDIISKAPGDDVKNYLLATSDFGKGMQDDINMYITRDRLNNASFRQKLDPIPKNILRRQNLLELAFKDISTFDAQNPIIRNLLRAIDVGKNDITSKLLKNLKDIELESRLEALKQRNNGDGNNIFPPPPLPTNFPPPPPPSSFQPPPLPTYLPPPQPLSFFSLPSPPRLSPQLPPSLNFNLPTKNNQPTIGRATKFYEIEAVKSDQELTRELPKNDIKHDIDELMRSIPSPPRLELLMKF